MRHIAEAVREEGVLSLEFRSSAVRRSLNSCFWEEKIHVMMALTHCSRDVPAIKGKVSVVGHFLSVSSTGPTVVCCGGADIGFIRALDSDPTLEGGVQNAFTLSFFTSGEANAQTKFQRYGENRHNFYFEDFVSAASRNVG